LAILENCSSSFRSVYRTWRRHDFKQILKEYDVRLILKVRCQAPTNSVLVTWEAYKVGTQLQAMDRAIQSSLQNNLFQP